VKRPARFPWLRILVHLLGWLPLVYLIYAFYTDKLTINPVQDLEQILGRIAIYWMVATLAVTPLYTLTGLRDLPNRRRAVGLYAFLYTCLHLLVFFGLDYAFNLAQIWNLVTGKVYLLVGVLGMLLLIPLAVTSFDYFIRKMGRNWKRLHWLVYPAVVVSILHYALAQKGDLFTLRGNILRPFLWLLFTLILLALRLPPVRRWVSGIRRKVVVRFRRLPQASKVHAG
jgi:methionine sulfoxide reductase heme-binding subunit